MGIIAATGRAALALRTAHQLRRADWPAERLGATPAQVALVWLLRRSPAMVIIPGTTNLDHLRANIAAAEVAKNLTGDEVARLTGLVDESKAIIDQPR